MQNEKSLTVAAHPTTLQVFDLFVKELGITKAAAMTDLLEAYMIATDRELYLRLKEDVLNTNSIADFIQNRSKTVKVAPQRLFNALWLRLTPFLCDTGVVLSPADIVTAYLRVINKKNAEKPGSGYVWFAINGPATGTGMAQAKVQRLRDLLSVNGSVPFLFSVGKTVEYEGRIIDFVIGPKPDDPDAIPSEFSKEEKFIWLKMDAFRRVTASEYDPSQIHFEPKRNKPDNTLEQVLQNGQVPFGYVCLG